MIFQRFVCKLRFRCPIISKFFQLFAYVELLNISLDEKFQRNKQINVNNVMNQTHLKLRTSNFSTKHSKSQKPIP